MKTKRKTCCGIVHLMICASVCAATSLTPVYAAGLEVFPQTVEMQFPQGYEVYSDTGQVLKTVPGPTSATIQAKAAGKAFAAREVYLSDWSYGQLQQGKSPNWIVPNQSSDDSVQRLHSFPARVSKVSELSEVRVVRNSFHRGFVNSAAFLKTADILATGSSDGSVKIWDLTRNHLIRTIKTPGPVGGVKY